MGSPVTVHNIYSVTRVVQMQPELLLYCILVVKHRCHNQWFCRRHTKFPQPFRKFCGHLAVGCRSIYATISRAIPCFTERANDRLHNCCTNHLPPLRKNRARNLLLFADPHKQAAGSKCAPAFEFASHEAFQELLARWSFLAFSGLLECSLQLCRHLGIRLVAAGLPGNNLRFLFRHANPQPLTDESVF